MTTLLKTAQNAVKNWFLLLIAGILFVALGIYCFTQPVESYMALSVVFSVSFIVIGIAEIVFSISNSETLKNWGWMLFFGIASLVVGVLLVQNPDTSVYLMPFYIGFLLMFRSIGGISYALDMKDYGILDWGNVMLISVLALILSFVMLWNPDFAGGTIVFWTALSLIMIGALVIYISFQLKKIKDVPQTIDKKLKEAGESIKKEVDEFTKPLRDKMDEASKSANQGGQTGNTNDNS